VIRITEGPTKLKLTGENRELALLASKLRFRPKGYEHAPSYKAFVLTDGHDGWDGYVTPIRFVTDTQAECLRGHKDLLIETAKTHDIRVDTTGCLVSPFESLTSDDIPADLLAADFELDQYQRESVAFWLSNGMGVNKIAVNGGKTAMFAAAAGMIIAKFNDARILYVTQSERLVRQAYKDIKGFMPGFEITQFGGSKKDKTGRDMVIATVAMLWANRQELIAERWFQTFMAVLYDESHHVCSPTSQRLMMQLPCFFRLGASDSKRDSDPAKVDKIRGLLGPIRYTVPVSTYIDIGRSAKPTIYLVENSEWMNEHDDVPFQAEPDTPAWALVGSEWKKGTYLGPVYELDQNGDIKTRKVRELEGADENDAYDHLGRVQTVKTARWVEVDRPVTKDGYHSIRFKGEIDPYSVDSRYCLLQRMIDKAVITFKERNELIVAWAKYYSRDRKFPTLVVCTRTMHVLILETMLKLALGEDMVQVLFSDHTPKQRDRAFEWFRQTPGSVLVSPLVKEGVSINEIRGGVIADYIGDWEVMNQIIGRFIRKKKGDNEAFITAFIDVQHRALRRGSRRVFNRLKDVRGYSFYHPCLGPDTIAQAKEFRKLA
jgi:superfamily II DNA or RNA helicase